ncbi:MAG: hydantoinase B/oxoprolinase family protein, partial [Pseudonocardiaceae bacterium]|nr:hydantoinase B/oxoprolinase family protein [Pseudonocardiaceae bacterium]
IAIHDDRWLTYPWGVNGGKPGARGRKWLERADGTREVLPSKCHDIPVAPGDVLHFVTWGGGGWGDPLARDPELVALEVKRGLVTVDGARDGYGVICDESGALDSAATDASREQKRTERAELAVFDMGPPMSEILRTCEAETG